eukprot:1146749-Pelagomonas_calceolata.AAC.1
MANSWNKRVKRFQLKRNEGVRSCCTFKSNERIRVRAEFPFNKVDVPVLRRDLGGFKMSLSAWDRAHKDSIRAALVPGRGASTIRENLSNLWICQKELLISLLERRELGLCASVFAVVVGGM